MKLHKGVWYATSIWENFNFELCYECGFDKMGHRLRCTIRSPGANSTMVNQNPSADKIRRLSIDSPVNEYGLNGDGSRRRN